MQQIWLMRHGQAYDDVNNTFGGWADDKPTPLALNEANEKINELKKLQNKYLTPKGVSFQAGSFCCQGSLSSRT